MAFFVRLGLILLCQVTESEVEGRWGCWPALAVGGQRVRLYPGAAGFAAFGQYKLEAGKGEVRNRFAFAHLRVGQQMQGPIMV